MAVKLAARRCVGLFYGVLIGLLVYLLGEGKLNAQVDPIAVQHDNRLIVTYFSFF